MGGTPLPARVSAASVSGDNLEVVDTIPGWVHEIKNIGDSELMVMLWANEIFDHESPDTISQQV